MSKVEKHILMGILDIITVIIFSVAVLVTGISLSKSGKDLKGFFGGGGGLILVPLLKGLFG